MFWWLKLKLFRTRSFFLIKNNFPVCLKLSVNENAGRSNLLRFDEEAEKRNKNLTAENDESCEQKYP